VFVVMLIERSFEGRHEHGGFLAAMAALSAGADAPHVLANTICVAGALLFYNGLAVVRDHLRTGSLARVFMTPRPAGPEGDTGGTSTRTHPC
jgi:hypothetical protein